MADDIRDQADAKSGRNETDHGRNIGRSLRDFGFETGTVTKIQKSLSHADAFRIHEGQKLVAGECRQSDGLGVGQGVLDR